MFGAHKTMAMSALKELRNVQLYLIFAKKTLVIVVSCFLLLILREI